MDLSSLLFFTVVLACPIGMGVMMWMMRKKPGDHAMTGDQMPANPDERLVALRTQRQALEAEIAETSRVAELEAQRDALSNAQASISRERVE